VSWHVIVTEFKQETVAQDTIHELGLETFLPKMRRITRSHHRLASPFLLIMPGYLFVQWDKDADRLVWHAITRQRGVKTILGLSEDRKRVTPIRDKDFARLQELAAELSMEVTISNARPKPLASETMVRVLFGPFEGMMGKIEIDNGIRADVLLASAGVLSRLTLPRELLEAAAI